MWYTFEKQLVALFLPCIWIGLIESQSIENDFRPSNIELIPDLVVLNSSSTAEFLCINHQFEDLPLMINLSKTIPDNQIEIIRQQLNQTALRIRIQLRNYLGIFHLFCYSKDKMNKGTRADVIVKTEPEPIVLTKKCQVFAREYIKCILQAPVIVRAIRNDFPAQFEFHEETNFGAYDSRYIFLKNESINEGLVFKWKPTIDGRFPDGVRMNMSIQIPYFSQIIHRFDMTPIFVVQLNFTLKISNRNQIEIRLKSFLPSVMCATRLTPRTNLIDTQWTPFAARQNITYFTHLKFDTNYRLCIRCRERSKDPYGLATCQTIKTWKKIHYQRIIIIIASLISSIILCLISGLLYYSCNHHQQIIEPPSIELNELDAINLTDQDHERNKPIETAEDDEHSNSSKYRYIYQN